VKVVDFTLKSTLRTAYRLSPRLYPADFTHTGEQTETAILPTNTLYVQHFGPDCPPGFRKTLVFLSGCTVARLEGVWRWASGGNGESSITGLQTMARDFAKPLLLMLAACGA